MTTTKIVAFVDILGFSKMIEEYDNGNHQILDNLIYAMNNAGSFIKSNIPIKDTVLFNFKDCIEAKLFSDCLCVSVPLEFGNAYNKYNIYDQFWFFYQYLSGYQILLFEKGIFTRGAVTIGSYYSDENIIFSGGLVEAYNLETKVANFPRIIVSDKLLDVFKHSKESNNWDYSKILSIDNTKNVFLNPFNYQLSTSEIADNMVEKFLSEINILGINDKSFTENDLEDRNRIFGEVLTFCEKEIAITTSDKIKEKYYWMIDYINYLQGASNNREFKEF